LPETLREAESQGRPFLDVNGGAYSWRWTPLSRHKI
jgi:hypothetical protein